MIDAFRHKMPSLIPFALENESILKLAAYLLKYTTGSKYTLHQYVFWVHRFSEWLDKKPDDIIREHFLDAFIFSSSRWTGRRWTGREEGGRRKRNMLKRRVKREPVTMVAVQAAKRRGSTSPAD